VPFLRRTEDDGRDSIFVGRIATLLIPCYYVSGDHIMQQGDMGNEMYFVLQGSLRIIVNRKQVATFGDGSFFGGKSIS
jgi:CRP-like cAMP-binding protein